MVLTGQSPKPWELVWNPGSAEFEIKSSRGSWIATVTNGSPLWRQIADGQLIAAAPILFATLYRMSPDTAKAILGTVSIPQITEPRMVRGGFGEDPGTT